MSYTLIHSNIIYDPIKILFELACGLRELHVNNIIHSDLKPENCLMKKGVAKISDLDCIIVPSNQVNTITTGTPSFRAPEIYLRKRQIYRLP